MDYIKLIINKLKSTPTEYNVIAWKLENVRFNNLKNSII